VELKREQHELTEGFGHGTSTWEDKYRDMKRVGDLTVWGMTSFSLHYVGLMQLLRSFRSLIEEIVLEDPDESGKYADCSVCYEELDKDSLPATYVPVMSSPITYPIDHASCHLSSSFPKSNCGPTTYCSGSTDFPANTFSIWSAFGSLTDTPRSSNRPGAYHARLVGKTGN
jgi:hypothetical protein